MKKVIEHDEPMLRVWQGWIAYFQGQKLDQEIMDEYEKEKLKEKTDV